MRNTLRTLTLFTRSLGFHSFLSMEQITENTEGDEVEDGGEGSWGVGGPRAGVQIQGREEQEIGKGSGVYGRSRIHYEICL